MKRIFSILITMIVFLSVSANDCKIQVKEGTKLVIERGLGSVFFDNDFECEKGGLLLIK